MLTEKKKFIVGTACFQWGFGFFIIVNIYMSKVHPVDPVRHLTAMYCHKPISATSLPVSEQLQ